MNSKLIFKIVSRVILLILGWLFLKDFLDKGWYDPTLEETYHFVELSATSSLGLYTFLSLRALGILVFGSFIFLYLLPSLLGLIYFIRLKRTWLHAIFLSLGLVSTTLLAFLLAGEPPEHQEHYFISILIAAFLTGVYVQGLVLVYRGKNLMLTDFGTKK